MGRRCHLQGAAGTAGRGAAGAGARGSRLFQKPGPREDLRVGALPGPLPRGGRGGGRRHPQVGCSQVRARAPAAQDALIPGTRRGPGGNQEGTRSPLGSQVSAHSEPLPRGGGRRHPPGGLLAGEGPRHLLPRMCSSQEPGGNQVPARISGSAHTQGPCPRWWWGGQETPHQVGCSQVRAHRTCCPGRAHPGNQKGTQMDGEGAETRSPLGSQGQHTLKGPCLEWGAGDTHPHTHPTPPHPPHPWQAGC